MIRCNCGQDPGESYSSFGHGVECPRRLEQRIAQLEAENEKLRDKVTMLEVCEARYVEDLVTLEGRLESLGYGHTEGEG